MRELLEKRVILVVGKGGVGRSTLAAAIAKAGAEVGKHTLIMEIGEPDQSYHATARLLGGERFTPTPTPLGPNLEGALLHSREGQGLFLHTVLPKAIPVRRVLGSKALSSLLDAAPSLNEMGVFYHLLDRIKATTPKGAPRHDLIVVDMPATGHALALTSLPTVLLKLLPDGAISELLREGQDYMYDPAVTNAVVVTLPETLPVTESIELMEGLQETSITIGGVFLNRFPAQPFTPEEFEAITPLLLNPKLFGGSSWRRLLGSRRAKKRLRTGTSAPIYQVPDVKGPSEDLLPTLTAALLKGADYV